MGSPLFMHRLHAPPRHLRLRSRVANVTLAVVMITTLVVAPQLFGRSESAAVVTKVATLRVISDQTVGTFTRTGCASHFDCIDDVPGHPDDATTKLSGPNKADTTATINLSGVPSDFLRATSVTFIGRNLRVGTGDDTVAFQYRIEGPAGEVISSYVPSSLNTFWDTRLKEATVGVSAANSATNWDAARVSIFQDYTQVSGADTDAYVELTALEVRVTYEVDPAGRKAGSHQDGYIVEADDGTTPQGNTVLAEGSTAATGIVQGDDITARFHVTNTGAALAATTPTVFGLGSNDVAVRAGASVRSGCTGTGMFKCALSRPYGNNEVVRFAPDGTLWLAMPHTVKKEVGSGGNCDGGTFACETVLSGTINNSHLTFTPSATPVMPYVTASGVFLATYVGSGGTGCAVATWNCVAVDSNVHTKLASAFTANGSMVLAGVDSGTGVVRVMRHVGSGGTGCTNTAWSCVSVVTLTTTSSVQMVIDDDNVVHLAYRQSGAIKHARQVASGGTGCTLATWQCESVSEPDDPFQMQVGANGQPVMVIRAPKAIRLGRFVAGDGTGCSSTNWSCETIRAFGMHSVAMAIDPLGRPWFAMAQDGLQAIYLQREKDGGTGCSIANYQCDTFASSFDGGLTSDIAISPNGTIAITVIDDFLGSHDIYLTNEVPPVKISTASQQGVDGTAVTTSHADMTSTTDTVNRDDADCLVAGAVWNNGKLIRSPNTATVGMPDGSVTPQCSEYSFVLNTADSALSTTYKLFMARKLSTSGSGNSWRPMFTSKSDMLTYTTGATGGGTAGPDGATGNQAPNAPASLGQSSNALLAAGAWTRSTSIASSASASDPDASDTLSLCVERKPLGTAFTNTEDGCGTGVAYSGSAVSLFYSATMTDGAYHWQARIKDAGGLYSAWVSFGGNAETDRDFGVDTVVPTTGTVFDGTVDGSDASHNTGSLDTLSANWSGFGDALSGIASYSYSVGTSAGAGNILGTTVGTATPSATIGSLVLETSQKYFVNVQAVDAAGNVSTFVSSNGQLVQPIVTIGVGAVASGASCGTLTTNAASTNGTLNMGGISFLTPTKTVGQTLNITTNAKNGYTVYVSYVGAPIGLAAVPGTNAAPQAFPATGTEAFGYSTSDADLAGGTANRFSGGLFAALTTSLAPVASSSVPTPLGESTCVAYSAQRATSTLAGSYPLNVTYNVVPNF